MDYNSSGFSVHGISQARILEWVAISFPRGFSRTRDRTHISCIGRQILYHRALREVIYVCVCVHVLSSFSCVWLFVTIWTVAHQGPLSMGFFRQEYWNGLLCPPSGDLPDQGIKPTSFTSPTLAGGFCTTSATWEAHMRVRGLQFFAFTSDLWLLSESAHDSLFLLRQNIP